MGGFLQRGPDLNYFRANRFLDTLPDWEAGHPPQGPMEHYLPRMRALLRRLNDPQRQFRSTIVGGTNGKGSTSSLLSDLLRAGGKNAGLYTSPHLHTVRERIRINGQVATRDLWAEGVTELYEKSRDFEREGFGPFSKFEALTALAALLFARENVEIGVFEVGLGGQFDATNAWDSELAVLTIVQLDHTSVLGNTVEEIAADKIHIARPGKPLFTTPAQHPDVLALLKRVCALRNISLHLVDETVRAENRPATFCQNAALAIAAGRQVLGDALTQDIVRTTIQAHTWPGRFEIVQQTPPIVLDGAHNPDAARELARELARLSDKWTFIVGASEGHDAEGILQALAPIAAEIVLTQAPHPRAVPATRLYAMAPKGTPVRIETDCLAILKNRLIETPSALPVCITGSLFLIAQAREVLDLPKEQDSFSEDVILESLRCLEIACQNLGLGLHPVSADGNVMRIGQNDPPQYFMRNKHPFNDYVSARLAEDKGYQYELFSKAGLKVPKTLTVFNPLADRRFDRYQTHASIADIVSDVIAQFSFPVVIKRNRGSMAQGVYLETDAEGLQQRLFELCEDSSRFDNVLLIQAFVEGPEYRIVANRDHLLLAYEKQNAPDIAAEDLNPLHRAGGVAVPVVDGARLTDFAHLVGQMNQVIDLGFYAIDLIAGAAGLHILEINPNPICHFYNHHNGRGDFVRIYEYLIRKYVLQESPAIPVLPAAPPALQVQSAGG